MTLLIRTFSYHYRTLYGHPVGKLPLDLGVVCPNREQGGCIFCRPASFTPGYLKAEKDICHQIKSGKKSILKSRFTKYLAYFQQETPTAISLSKLLSVISTVLADPDCLGLILSTRPDYVEEKLLAPLSKLIKDSQKECLFELGLQSIHDKSLILLNRNHTCADFVQAVRRIQSYTVFRVGAHLILGIPGESFGDMAQTIHTVSELGISDLKIHHLQVIKRTPLEEMYRRGELQLFTRQEYVRLLLRLLPEIPHNVIVHRLWATSHPELLVAPRWNVLASVLSQQLLDEMVKKEIWQGKNVQTQLSESVIFP